MNTYVFPCLSNFQGTYEISYQGVFRNPYIGDFRGEILTENMKISFFLNWPSSPPPKNPAVKSLHFLSRALLWWWTDTLKICTKLWFFIGDFRKFPISAVPCCHALGPSFGPPLGASRLFPASAPALRHGVLAFVDFKIPSWFQGSGWKSPHKNQNFTY